jgi:hypothetical protein
MKPVVREFFGKLAYAMFVIVVYEAIGYVLRHLHWS